jgi:hypothetical protein
VTSALQIDPARKPPASVVRHPSRAISFGRDEQQSSAYILVDLARPVADFDILHPHRGDRTVRGSSVNWNDIPGWFQWRSAQEEASNQAAVALAIWGTTTSAAGLTERRTDRLLGGMHAR